MPRNSITEVLWSPYLFNLRHRELAVDAIGIESDLVADFHLLELRPILHAKDHRHPFVHVELFDRTVLERDFARGLVDLRHLTVDHGSLGHGHRRERERKDADAYRSESYLAHGSSPSFFSRALLHADPSDHALLIVAGNETGELERAAPGELPNDLAVAVRQQALCIRIVMLHVWILFHHLRVLAIFSDRREDEFVILLAIVLQDETDLFPPAHLNARGLVTHLAAALEHLDLVCARGVLGITRPASREISVILMGGRRTRHCDMRRQHRAGRCEKDANGDD